MFADLAQQIEDKKEKKDKKVEVETVTIIEENQPEVAAKQNRSK